MSIYFGTAHSILVLLLEISVFRCCFSDPGYVKNAIYVNTKKKLSLIDIIVCNSLE